MLSTTASVRRLASSTRARWPSWRYPIVGTRPMRRPASCWPPLQPRISAMVVSSVKAVLLPRILSVPHLRGKGPHRVPHGLSQLAVVLEKLGGKLFVESEHVVQHQNLAVAVRSSANANGRDGQRLGDLGRYGSGNELENHSTGAGRL